MTTKFQKLRKFFVSARTALEFTSSHSGIFVGSAKPTFEYPEIAYLKIPHDINDRYSRSTLNGRKK